MSGASHRRVGNACEREVVDRHLDLGIKAERYPLSGASRFRGSGHDVDIYAFGPDEAPCVAEVKKRKGGAGFTQLERWLGEYDLLVLRRNHADPMLVLPWRTWAALLMRGAALTRLDYLLAELRAASLRARLWQADIEAVGIALKHGLIHPEQALELLYDCDALHLVDTVRGEESA